MTKAHLNDILYIANLKSEWRLQMKKYIFIIATLLIVALFFIPVNCLVLEHYQTGEILLLFNVQADDEFTVKWIHSVELTPWEEIFRIDDNNKIVLDRTRFQQFGAGVPDSAGTKTEYKDGYIIFSGINQKMDLLPYGISSFAKHSFIFKNREYELYKLVKDGDRINFYTAKISLIKYLKINYLNNLFSVNSL